MGHFWLGQILNCHGQAERYELVFHGPSSDRKSQRLWRKGFFGQWYYTLSCTKTVLSTQRKEAILAGTQSGRKPEALL